MNESDEASRPGAPSAPPKTSADPAAPAGGPPAASADPDDRIGEPFYRFQALKRTNPGAAVRVFSEFRQAMRQRMDWEDRELFQKFAGRVGAGAEKISERMRQEHQQIREVLDAIAEKLARSDLATEGEERDLEKLLSDHNHREYQVVYSALEG